MLRFAQKIPQELKQLGKNSISPKSMKNRTSKTVENVPELKPKDSLEYTVEKKLTKTLDHSIAEKVKSTKEVVLKAVGSITDHHKEPRIKCARTKDEGFS